MWVSGAKSTTNDSINILKKQLNNKMSLAYLCSLGVLLQTNLQWIRYSGGHKVRHLYLGQTGTSLYQMIGGIKFS